MPVLMRESGIDDKVAEFLAYMDERLERDQSKVAGLFDIHGRALTANEIHTETYWLHLSAL